MRSPDMTETDVTMVKEECRVAALRTEAELQHLVQESVDMSKYTQQPWLACIVGSLVQPPMISLVLNHKYHNCQVIWIQPRLDASPQVFDLIDIVMLTRDTPEDHLAHVWQRFNRCLPYQEFVQHAQSAWQNGCALVIDKRVRDDNPYPLYYELCIV
jgi:hypothetical protein